MEIELDDLLDRLTPTTLAVMWADLMETDGPGKLADAVMAELVRVVGQADALEMTVNADNLVI